MLFSRPLGCSQVVQLHWRGSTIERGGEVHQACHRWRAQHQTEVRNDARPWQLRGSAQRVGRVCGGAVVCMPGGAYVLCCNHVWLLVHVTALFVVTDSRQCTPSFSVARCSAAPGQPLEPGMWWCLGASRFALLDAHDACLCWLCLWLSYARVPRRALRGVSS